MSAKRVILVRPTSHHRDEFLERVETSRRFHRPWVYPLQTSSEYARFLARLGEPAYESFFMVERKSGHLAGVFSLSEITRGVLQSAYLGFYALAPFQHRGYMTEGLHLIVRHAFVSLRLHRVEANIQPDNTRSKTLVARCGFRNEGYSPRYLKIGGRWRDHERWAILVEDWREFIREGGA